MLIRCKIERKNGSTTTMDGITYHFQQAGPRGEHVAEVSNKKHIARFLAIAEAYEIVDGAAGELPPPLSKSEMDARARLEEFSLDQLVVKFGRDSSYGLKIDKRYSKENAIDIVMDALAIKG